MDRGNSTHLAPPPNRLRYCRLAFCHIELAYDPFQRHRLSDGILVARGKDWERAQALVPFRTWPGRLPSCMLFEASTLRFASRQCNARSENQIQSMLWYSHSLNGLKIVQPRCQRYLVCSPNTFDCQRMRVISSLPMLVRSGR